MEMDNWSRCASGAGFLFQSSEIYGGLNGFWDYGPLGVELKRNVREAWWRDMVTGHNELAAPPGAPAAYEMVGLDCTIIMHPQVWKCSGHYDLFHDFMVDCRESKKRYRHDQVTAAGSRPRASGSSSPRKSAATTAWPRRSSGAEVLQPPRQGRRRAAVGRPLVSLTTVKDFRRCSAPTPRTGHADRAARVQPDVQDDTSARWRAKKDAAFLRPETAQGIFVNFKNVRRQHAACGFPSASPRSARASATRSRRGTSPSARASSSRWRSSSSAIPSTSPEWYQYWRDRRYQWYLDLGLAGDRLRLRDHDTEELSHYSCGTADIEYAFPFLAAGRVRRAGGRGPSRRLRPAQPHGRQAGAPGRRSWSSRLDADGKPRHRGSGKDLTYFDDQTKRAVRAARDRAFGRRRPGHAGLPLRGLPRGRGARRERQAARSGCS